jgi:hypothetical protein
MGIQAPWEAPALARTKMVPLARWPTPEVHSGRVRMSQGRCRGQARERDICVEAELDIDLRADPGDIPAEKWDRAIGKLEDVKRQLSRERKRRGRGILSY